MQNIKTSNKNPCSKDSLYKSSDDLQYKYISCILCCTKITYLASQHLPVQS